MKNIFLRIFYFVRKLSILKKPTNSLLRRILFIIKKDKFLYDFKNIKLFIHLRDSIDREIFMNGYYEEEQISLLCSLIDENSIDYFIDVGANVGIYSLLISKKFLNLKTYAFEPHPHVFKRLQKNINLNNLEDKISTYNYALSNKLGSSLLYSRNKFNIKQSGGATINELGNIKIKTDKGDNLLEFKEKKIAIKIDTEGHELFVLEGLKNLLSSNSICLQIEIFPNNVDQVLSFLNKLNFKLIKKSNFTHQKEILDYFFIN
jgi:FkbM family methyltransferase